MTLATSAELGALGWLFLGAVAQQNKVLCPSLSISV